MFLEDLTHSTLLLESYSYYMDMIYQTMDNTTKVILEDQKED
jgi:hypothetical protein